MKKWTSEQIAKWCEEHLTMKHQTTCTATREKFYHYVKYENGDTYEHTETATGESWHDRIITKINGITICDYIVER